MSALRNLGKLIGIKWTRKQWLRYLEVFAYLILPLLALFFIETGIFPRKPCVIAMVTIFSLIWVFLFLEEYKGSGALEEFAEGNQFSMSEEDSSLEELFSRTHLASFGKKINFSFHQKQKSVGIYAFEHRVGYKHPNVHTVFMIFSKQLNFPHFILGERTSAEDIFYNYFNNFEKIKVSIYDDPEFMRFFEIKGPDVGMINSLLDKDVRSAFDELKNDDLYFEASRNCFLIHKYRKLDLDECKAMYSSCKKLFQALFKNQGIQIKKSNDPQQNKDKSGS